MLPRLFLALFFAATVQRSVSAESAEVPKLHLKKGDRIVFVGNTFAERMLRHGYFEAAIHQQFPELQLTFRNLGWSGDEIWAGNASPKGNAWSGDPLTTQIRPLHFGDQRSHLTEQKADVIFACYGMNESFAGPEQLGKFSADFTAWIEAQKVSHCNGSSAPRIVLVSPICHEKLGGLHTDPAKHNANLAAYTAAMRKVAQATKVAFIDLFHPTQTAMAKAAQPFTINGIHLSEVGYREVAAIMCQQLSVSVSNSTANNLLAAINHKNQWFFHRYHALNGEYIYGRRKEPFGVVNFPPEMSQLDQLIEQQDAKIWELLNDNIPTP